MMSFGPEWLRSNVSGGGGGGGNLPSSVTANGGGSDLGPIKLAQYRYGREEMLALFYDHVKPPEDLRSRVEDEGLFIEHVQKPIAFITMTDEETRQWNRGVNCDLVLRSTPAGAPTGLNPPLNGGMGGGLRGGRGGSMSVDRGRGRGRGYYYNRYGSGGTGSEEGVEGGRGHRSFSQMDRGWSERNGGDPSEWNGSTSPRKEYGGRSGGLENWRRGRQNDEDEGWRQREKWSHSHPPNISNRSSWRDETTGEGAPETGKGRSSNWGRGWADEGLIRRGGEGRRGGGGGGSGDEVPEWATEVQTEMAGSFDADGAFHGVCSDEEESSEQLTKTEKTSPPPEPPTRSKTVTDIPSKKSPPNSSVSKSQSSVQLTDAQQLQRIRSQHQHFVDNKGEKVENEDKCNNKTESVEVPRQPSDDDITRLADSVVNSLIGDEEREKDKLDSADKWYYRDPQGVEQGPFRSSDMYDWFENGYFQSNLLVRRGNEKKFSQLGELRAAAGGVVPFAPPDKAAVAVAAARAAAAAAALPPFAPAANPSAPDVPFKRDFWNELTPAQRLHLAQHPLLANPNPLAQINPMNNLMNQLQSQPRATPSANEQTSLSVQQFFQRISRGQQMAANYMPGMPVTPQMPILPNSLGRTNPVDIKDEVLAEFMLQINANSLPQAAAVNSLWSGPGRPQNWTPTSAPPAAPSSFWEADPSVLLKAKEEQIKKEQEEQRLYEQQERLKQELERKEKERLEQEKLERERHEDERKRREAEENLRVFLGLDKLPGQQDEPFNDGNKKQRQEDFEKARIEEENRRKVEEQKKKEAQKKKEEKDRKREEERERKRLAEEVKKREEEEKKRLEKEAEERARQEEEEEERKELDKQRRQSEALKMLSEQQPMKPRLKPWSQTPLAPPSLAEIQAQEQKNKKESQSLLQFLNQEVQQPQPETQKHNGLNLKWAQVANPPKVPVKTLAEIQAEEQIKLFQQQEKERRDRAERMRLAQDLPLMPGGNIWAGSTPLTSSNSSTSLLSSMTSGAPLTTSRSVGALGAWAAAVQANNNSGQQPQQQQQQQLQQKGFWEEAKKVKGKSEGNGLKGVTTISTTVTTKKTLVTPILNQKISKTKPKKDEAAVMKLFEVQDQDEFTQWAISALHNLHSNIDVPTFTVFLRDVESPYDVKEYVRDYLGESREAQEFARQFIERRSRWKSQLRAATQSEDDMCAPAQAINPAGASSSGIGGSSSGGNAGGIDNDGKKGKKAKKGKMQRVDSRILGFSVTAAPNRINIGERETYDPHS